MNGPTLRSFWSVSLRIGLLAPGLAGCDRRVLPVPSASTAPEPGPASVRPIRVKTVQPRRGTDVAVRVEQPAEVSPYYRVTLYAQAAGTVSFLEKDLGDEVSAGERLLEITPTPGTTAPPEALVLKAPFDGVIASRSVDPGSFVPSAAIVPGASPLLVVERHDIVTVAMKVPDTFAAQVTSETEAELRFDALPGKLLRCRLSRLAPSLDRADRTLRVEVDLYNGPREDFDELVQQAEATDRADLKGRQLPVFPEGLNPGEAAGLLPGLYGQMTLVLGRFDEVLVVPSAAIARRGGLPYLDRVVDGHIQRCRVAVDFDDGRVARVFWLESEGSTTVRRELQATDQLVLSQQGELEDGQAVEATLTTW